ncbi:outer membrane protein OmpA-like peptidoglycan-associated protein [Novosphingobium sp. SG751A]|uniref:OmpA family protein n=1 Tax=Novosphingobium sp. SG751A TaxID=2587000 RepID=UPI001558280B|nr:OmpA family protein [Novosphingobium sp. SG751A]NOW45428.1 outer membrane protein OmpA-like peptidoglycan-associated protein [Novosphingobium sp. SG751A]
MTKARIFTAGFAVAALLVTSGCVTDPNTGQQKVSRTAIGAGAGALGGMLLGGLIGGGTGRIIGAGIGGIAGGAIGYERDKQIKQLREQTAGTGVDIRPSDDGRSIMLSLPDGVTFDTGSYMLHPQFRPTLDKIAQSLKDYPNSLIDVYGHTDSTGSAQLNQTLSENRARTVGDYLGMQGVSQARIRTQGYGATMPVADNATPEGRAKNRRVEIKIVPITQEQVNAARGQ